jgi:hypothetical protein
MTTCLQHRQITGEVLKITRTEAVVLGPDLTLSNCRILLNATWRTLTIVACRFEDCTIEAKARLVNFQGWCNAWIERCCFRGTFSGCDFGAWPPAYHQGGGIKDCDFRDAVLDGCRFFGEYAGSLRLPSWPCFAIREPKRAAPSLQRFRWPGKAQYFIAAGNKDPEECRLVVAWAPSLLKGTDATEAELREVVVAAGLLPTSG